MRVAKKYLSLSMVLLLYIAAIAILLRQFAVYQKAYFMMSSLISHPTIEVTVQEETEGE